MSRINTNNLRQLNATVDNISLDSSGNVAIQGGAAATPSLYFSGDADTGISSPGADSVAISTGGSARATVDSSGRLLVGTSSAITAVNAQYGKFQAIGNTYATPGGAIMVLGRSEDATSITSGEGLATISFTDNAAGEFASISAQADGTAGTNDYPGRIIFSTTADGASNPTERMRITSLGRVDVTGNSAGQFIFSILNDGNNNNRYGLEISCGTDNSSGTNYAVQFYDGDGSTQGAITFTGGTVTYGAFTAHHPCILPEEDNENGYPYGTLLETVAIEYTEKNGVATERGIRYKVRKTQAANSKAVLGAYGSSMNGGPDGETNSHQALVLGDGHILCNGLGGNIKVGDGICSSAVAGIGQKATATPSMIIGISQEDVTFDGDETKLVPVQYGLQQFIPWQD